MGMQIAKAEPDLGWRLFPQRPFNFAKNGCTCVLDRRWSRIPKRLRILRNEAYGERYHQADEFDPSWDLQAWCNKRNSL